MYLLAHLRCAVINGDLVERLERYKNWSHRYRTRSRSLSSSSSGHRTQYPDVFNAPLNDVDVPVPGWKREWLKPAVEFYRVHRTLLESVTASIFRRSGHFDAGLRAISRYRETRMFKNYRRLR
jgi:hypothetical protein